ncbi:MerR family transcriptional regulator [Sulfuriflexus mobilis]|uniref:MerR family transcriptional regulator n=1 Tax=Sulfuriflexus mobilis TaxID=1811807 RepID=UPI000F83A149|nr:MerR family DNA-binding protein [Sulfuriflexus mobilis]
MPALTISRLAREAGVGVETVRYYQRIGLLEEPPKPAEGYRVYPGQALSRLQFIARAKELGFTLNEIKELLLLDNADCQQTQEIAGQKLQSIHARIHDLTAMAETLEHLLRSCQGHATTAACPIIDSLNKP